MLAATLLDDLFQCTVAFRVLSARLWDTRLQSPAEMYSAPSPSRPRRTRGASIVEIAMDRLSKTAAQGIRPGTLAIMACGIGVQHATALVFRQVISENPPDPETVMPLVMVLLHPLQVPTALPWRACCSGDFVSTWERGGIGSPSADERGARSVPVRTPVRGRLHSYHLGQSVFKKVKR